MLIARFKSPQDLSWVYS
uniref:Uncharacterized protein n=1 Tax=Arundo donax TaxID=35708 RepID=A0A0A9AJJ5_ARUDO